MNGQRTQDPILFFFPRKVRSIATRSTASLQSIAGWHPKLASPEVKSRSLNPADTSTRSSTAVLLRLSERWICILSNCLLGMPPCRARFGTLMVRKSLPATKLREFQWRRFRSRRHANFAAPTRRLKARDHWLAGDEGSMLPPQVVEIAQH